MNSTITYKQYRYRAKPKVKGKKYVTSVALIKTEDEKPHVFFCNDCRNAIMQYKGEVIQIIPGYTEAETPIIVQCANKDCQRRYQFTYFVEPAK